MIAKLSDGFCGLNVMHLVRVPLQPPGKASWAIILSIIHPEKALMILCHPLGSLANGPSICREDNLPSGISTGSDYARDASIQLSKSAPYMNNATDAIDPAGWLLLPHRALLRHESRACTQISRTTLITMMILTNARSVFQYSEAAGFRA